MGHTLRTAYHIRTARVVLRMLRKRRPPSFPFPRGGRTPGAKVRATYQSLSPSDNPIDQVTLLVRLRHPIAVLVTAWPEIRAERLELTSLPRM
jgi:hypothetical protein